MNTLRGYVRHLIEKLRRVENFSNLSDDRPRVFAPPQRRGYGEVNARTPEFALPLNS